MSTFDPTISQPSKARTPILNSDPRTYFSDKFIETSKKHDTQGKKSNYTLPKFPPTLGSSTAKSMKPKISHTPPNGSKNPTSFTLGKGGRGSFLYKKKSNFGLKLSQSLGPGDFAEETKAVVRKDISNARQIFESPDLKKVEAHRNRMELEGVRGSYSGFLEGLIGEHETVGRDRSNLGALGREISRDVKGVTKVAFNHIRENLVYGMQNSEKARKNAQWVGVKQGL